MDINLVLSAQTLVVSPHIRRSALAHGLIVLKNPRKQAYLRVTPDQWVILGLFETPRTVPEVLGVAIYERLCLPLGEFYELVLKAVRAGVLEEPGSEAPPDGPPPARSWRLRTSVAAVPLLLLFLAALAASLWFPPVLPSSPLEWAASLGILCAGLCVASLLRAALVRGAGGELASLRWKWAGAPPHLAVEAPDAAMLAPAEQTAAGLAGPALLAAVAAATLLARPALCLFPLAGLVAALRPGLGGRFLGLIHAGRKRGLSDAEHSYIFPPNRGPEGRLRMLRRALGQPTVWARVAYGCAWAAGSLFLAARLAGVAPWRPRFWKMHGFVIGETCLGLLASLLIGYLAWEMFLMTRSRAIARRDRVRTWWRRWFGGGSLPVDEASLLRYISSSSVLGALDLETRQELARRMRVSRHRLWTRLAAYGDEPSRVALVLNGRVAARRYLPSGRTAGAGILSEGDVIGMHDLADPKFPRHRLRARTPLVLLSIERSLVAELILEKVPPAELCNLALKAPFLRQVELCRPWHRQAVDRFARLSTITAYEKGAAILTEGQTVEMFYIIFQGNAKVSRRLKPVGTVRAREFFGEIGLMQNSGPNASVTANRDTRCLAVPRAELLRFVTNNHNVALELERVSSERLGRPIFPLKKGDFRAL
ncbi:MAG TPA: cyclic nucleotide-binding domain-containing protein [Opitutaceae bacterium]|jgi:CRP-like cAMP-binding protein